MQSTENCKDLKMEQKLTEWESRLNMAQAGHYIVSERYLQLNLLFSVPLVFLSVVVGSFLFFQSAPDEATSVLLKDAAIAVAILSPLQTLIRPSEKAEMHRVKASRYGCLKRKIEFFSLNNDRGAEWASFSKEIMYEWNSVAEDSPLTPDSARKKIKKLAERS
ncbi:SLATT domain-containing protein [Pseudomonas silesiensis]|uniref:SLATT domain-containing protein n=1 Tax=Pseudomonas silesiensis TaxID=1853130 RepID=UPI0034D786EF